MRPSGSDGDSRSLPLAWRRARLGDLVREAQPGFASGRRDPTGVVQLRMNNVTNSCRLDWTSVIRVPADAAAIEAFRLQPGDILFNNTNSEELVGKSALFEGFDEPVVFSNHFTRVRTDDDRLAPEFLAAWFQERWISGLFRQICHRWVGQAAVQSERLLELEMPLPDIREQRRIAQALRKQMAEVQRVHAAAEARWVASESLAEAWLRDVFDRPAARAWPARRIGEFADTCSGTTPARGRRDYYGGTIPWARTTELRDGVITETEERITDLALRECRLTVLPRDTLLIAMYGQGQTRGRTALLGAPATVNQACFAILPNPSVFDSKFLQLWFRRNYKRLRAKTEGRGCNQPNLNGLLLRDQVVALPPVDEQKRTIALLQPRLDDGVRLASLLERELLAIKKLPELLLRRAFSGEL